MNIQISERQYRLLFEEFSTASTEDSDEIMTDFDKQGQYKWFDYINPDFAEKHGINKDFLEKSLKETFKFLHSYFQYPLKRVVVKDKDQIVGFLIFSNTTEKKERIGKDDKPYTVLLSTAVHPQYRQRGLLKKMIEGAGIQKPYLVHTSPVSTPQVWEKMGCKKVGNLMGSEHNTIEKCD